MAKTETAPKTAATPAAATPAAASKARKARKPVDPNETPDARFKRIAGKRVARALSAMKGIEQIGKSQARKDKNTGNWRRNKDGSTSGYAYSDAQAEKVVQYLTDAVASVKRALAPRQAMKATEELIDL